MRSGTKPFKIIRVYDEAIQCQTPAEAEAFGRYCTSRDAEELSFVQGATVFWGRPLTVSERRTVANKSSDRDKYEAAFVLGLVKVENQEYPDGSRKEWVRPTDQSGKEKPIPDDALDDFFDETCVQEIGMVIAQRSFLAHTKGHWYPLPAICQHVLAARLLLRAGQTSASSTSPGSKAPAGPATPASPPSSPAGVEPGAVTATG
jgi:hypothetical protein